MLTDKSIKSAKPKPGKKYRKLSDQGGLYLFLTNDGTRSWRYDYRLKGKRQTLALGLYPETSLSEARERHSAARKQVGTGESPVLIRRRARQASIIEGDNTFGVIAEAWFKETAGGKSESWCMGHRRRLDKYILPALGSMPISDIEAADILVLVKGIDFKK